MIAEPSLSSIPGSRLAVLSIAQEDSAAPEIALTTTGDWPADGYSVEAAAGRAGAADATDATRTASAAQAAAGHAEALQAETDARGHARSGGASGAVHRRSPLRFALEGMRRVALRALDQRMSTEMADLAVQIRKLHDRDSEHRL